MVVLLLGILFGLKNCSMKYSGGPSSSEPDSHEPIYNYTDEQLTNLDNKLKNLVKLYRETFLGLGEDNLVDVKAVIFTEDKEARKASLSISVTSESNKLYYYRLENYYYPDGQTSFDNFVDYLLLEGTPDFLISECKEDHSHSVDEYNVTSKTITTDKQCDYVITDNNSHLDTFIDGYYFENGVYHVYQHKPLTTDPFGEQSSLDVDYAHILFTYYQKLNSLQA